MSALSRILLHIANHVHQLVVNLLNHITCLLGCYRLTVADRDRIGLNKAESGKLNTRDQYETQIKKFKVLSRLMCLTAMLPDCVVSVCLHGVALFSLYLSPTVQEH